MNTSTANLTARTGPGQRPDRQRRRLAGRELGVTTAVFFFGYLGVPRLVSVAAGSHRLSVSIWGAILGDLLEVAAVLALVHRTQPYPLPSLRLRPPKLAHLALTVPAAIASTALSAVTVGVLHIGKTGLGRIGQLPISERAALIVTVAVAEEIIYRGVLLTRVKELTGSTPLSVAVSATCFAAAHVSFFGPAYFLSVAIPALGLGALFVATDSLVVCMGVHLLVDLPILLLR